MILRKLIIQSCTLLLVVSWGVPVMAGSINLYEGKNGSQDLLGVLSDEYKKPKEGEPGKISKDGNYIELNFQHKDIPLQDDEAKSAILKGVRPGTVIELYDDPGCSKKYDWAKITVNKLKDKIVIGSFEKSASGKNDAYKIKFHDKGIKHVKHLNGKVSAIKIPKLPYHVGVPSTRSTSKKFRQENPGIAIFLEAERIVANIKDTAYSHTTNVDDDAGRYLLDCSGLLDYILGKSLPLENHYKDMLALAKNEGHKRPLAGTIYNYLSTGDHKGWTEIKYLRHARPGDIIVEKYSEKPSSGSTGHVMIVAGWGKKLNKEKCKRKSCWEYRIPIIESARGSLSYDSRDSASYNVWPATSTKYIGKNKTGVGKGFIYFRVNQEGEIICHQRNKHADLVCDGNYVIGRTVPLPTK